jgi:hypothetical protein
MSFFMTMKRAQGHVTSSDGGGSSLLDSDQWLAIVVPKESRNDVKDPF